MKYGSAAIYFLSPSTSILLVIFGLIAAPGDVQIHKPTGDVSGVMHASGEGMIEVGAGSARIPWIANEGQLHPDVAFVANTFTGAVFITNDGRIVYNLPVDSTRSYALHESFLGAGDFAQQMHGIGRSQTKISYFRGNDPDKWYSGVAAFNCVNLGEVWSGVSVELKSYGRNVEKLFIVDPHADPDVIKMQIDGAEDLVVSESGELVVSTPFGDLTMTKPVAWQMDDGVRSAVDIAWATEGKSCHFEIGDYTNYDTLFIDPLLASTFLGGSLDDIVRDLYVADSAVYVVGMTTGGSPAFPTTPGVYDQTHNGGSDAFISRFDLDLSTLEASTFLGGGAANQASAVTVHNDTVYIAGVAYTGTSPEFPTTPGAYDQTHNGGERDGIVASLSGDLSTLIASTFIGGGGPDWARCIEIHNNQVVVAGTAENGSSDFPITPGAYDNTLAVDDAFITIFSKDLSSISASTFLGGDKYDFVSDIAAKGSSIFVSGSTFGLGTNPVFPTTPGAYDQTHNDGIDGFIARMSDDLTTLEAATLLGGGANDVVGDIVVTDSFVYATGYTLSGSTFPTTAGAYDETANGSGEVFVSRLDHDLTTLSASTFIGGNAFDSGNDIEYSCGEIYITGVSNGSTSDYPTTSDAFDQTFNGAQDGIITVIDADLTSLSYSSFIGGDGSEAAFALEVTMSGVFIAGWTNGGSPVFPTTSGAYDQSFNGINDGFVALFDIHPTDTDGDGLCDFEDPDDDNDGVADAQDADSLDPQVCEDADGDGCDDCSQNTSSSASDTPWPGYTPDDDNDGPDTDGDGICNNGDTDDDNDGVPDVNDNAPLDPDSCQDLDNDGCDDCAVGTDGFGPMDDFNVNNDGTDTDGDGLCDAGDPDDDNDGVADVNDIDPFDPQACEDADGDGCDDCSANPTSTASATPWPEYTPDPSNDGPDSDGDGVCNSGEGGIAGFVKTEENEPIGNTQIYLHQDVDLDGVPDTTGPVEFTFTTASSGSYAFVSVNPGNYVVREVQPSGYTSVQDGDTSPDGDSVANTNTLDDLIPVTIVAGKLDFGNNFIETAIPGSIEGTVYEDMDDDEMPDPGEGIQDVWIKLFEDENQDGMPDSGSPVDSVQTDTAGHYTFTSVSPGDYLICQEQPDGFNSVLDHDPTPDSDAVSNSDPLDDKIPCSIFAGEADVTNDFIEAVACSRVVSNSDDSGIGSLRHNIDCATEGDTIWFDPGLSGDTIWLTSTHITIAKDLIIYSDVGPPRVFIASEVSGTFEISTGASVVLTNLEIISGTAAAAGALVNEGNLTLQDIGVHRNLMLPPATSLIIGQGTITIAGDCSVHD